MLLVRGIGRFGHTGALTPLVNYLSHEDPELVAAAAGALERISGAGFRENVEEPWEIDLPPGAVEPGAAPVPTLMVEKVITHPAAWSRPRTAPIDASVFRPAEPVQQPLAPRADEGHTTAYAALRPLAGAALPFRPAERGPGERRRPGRDDPGPGGTGDRDEQANTQIMQTLLTVVAQRPAETGARPAEPTTLALQLIGSVQKLVPAPVAQAGLAEQIPLIKALRDLPVVEPPHAAERERERAMGELKRLTSLPHEQRVAALRKLPGIGPMADEVARAMGSLPPDALLAMAQTLDVDAIGALAGRANGAAGG